MANSFFPATGNPDAGVWGCNQDQSGSAADPGAARDSLRF